MRRRLLFSVVVCGVVTLLLVILLPLSFHSLEYYQYGFVRQKSTGRVDTSQLYTSGKYFLGLDYEFKIFPAGAHHVHLTNIDAYTREKLKISLTLTFQYFLRPGDLHLLHKAYNLQYQGVIWARAVDAIKRVMPAFNISQMFTYRGEVERQLYHAVQQRLAGECCPSTCSVQDTARQPSYAGVRVGDKTTYAVCPSGCEPPPCGIKDKGIFVDVRYFQLRGIEIPFDVIGHHLHQVMLFEDTLREQLQQEATLLRRETDAMVHKIHIVAVEITEKAEAESQLIQTLSWANYTKTVESARSHSLQIMFKTLGITSQEHKVSLDYLQTLLGFHNCHMTVDFQQLIAGDL